MNALLAQGGGAAREIGLTEGRCLTWSRSNLFDDVIDADLLAACLFKRLFSLFLSLHHAQSTLSDR